MKQRIIPWLLAGCLIASMFASVSAANVTAQQIAQDYSQVLAESTLRSTTDRPVMFYDLTRDGVPEMILLCRGKSGGELQVWTWRSGSAELALSLDWVEVSASKHWLYLMKDGTLAW